MKHEDFRDAVIRELSTYKMKHLGITQNGVWKNNHKKYAHILPESFKQLNILPTATIPKGIKEHSDCHHLNSSQILCVNFFEPLLHHDQGNLLLLNILKEALKIKIEPKTKIKNACFEYQPDTNEGTNFDFYLELSDGMRIYFEIKYTENGFGTASIGRASAKYEHKWLKIYRQHLKESLYLKCLEQEAFYKDYQIWRNIAYIRTEKDYVVFLIPFENGSLIKDLKKTIGFPENRNYPNVTALSWEVLIHIALNWTKNTEYFRHFYLFSEKYRFSHFE